MCYTKNIIPENGGVEHINCDLCGSHDYDFCYKKPDTWLWLDQYEYSVVKCKKCGLVYVNPRPTPESMSSFYPDKYYINRDDENHQKRYAIQMDYLPNLHNEKILDIGCAKGDFLAFLKLHFPNLELFGMDFYSDGVNTNNIQFQNKKLTECQYPDAFFDIITAWAVFEHLHIPSEYFFEVNRILKAGGKFIFLVTNSESLYSKQAFQEDIPRHLYHFSEKTLEQYALKTGFNLTHIWYDDRIFDGRGIGTFYFALTSLFGCTWEGMHNNRMMTNAQKVAGVIGRLLDNIIFYFHWETLLKRSGIVIVEFTKTGKNA